MMWMYNYTLTKILVKYSLQNAEEGEKRKSKKYVLEWAKN